MSGFWALFTAVTNRSKIVTHTLEEMKEAEKEAKSQTMASDDTQKGRGRQANIDTHKRSRRQGQIRRNTNL